MRQVCKQWDTGQGKSISTSGAEYLSISLSNKRTLLHSIRISKQETKLASGYAS